MTSCAAEDAEFCTLIENRRSLAVKPPAGGRQHCACILVLRDPAKNAAVTGCEDQVECLLRDEQLQDLEA